MARWPRSQRATRTAAAEGVKEVKRLIAEWLWRAVVLCVLGVIAWELQRVHEDITAQPSEDASTMVEAPEETLRSVDAIRDDIADLAQKMDAIRIAIARAK